MRPLSIAGWILVVVGVVVLGMRGVGYTKERRSARVGPFEMTAERRGFVPPVAGAIALVLGVGLVVAGRRRNG